jgi:RecA-family ATPase
MDFPNFPKGVLQTPSPLLTATQFMATFTWPDYLVDGIIQRGRLTALTSPTGHGKTAVALLLACMIATGRNLGNIEVTQGHVVFLAGENPDDLCGRCFAACETYSIDAAKLPIHFLPGNFPMTEEAAERLKQMIDDLEVPIALIIGDSAAAFFPGDNDNDNVQQGSFARSSLRILNRCQGKPGVMILCHPVKNAAKDNLLPRGGGAFLNELDVNLTLWADAQGETTTLHWQGKIRGADFQPVNFALNPVRLRDKVDAKGRPFMSVVATLQTEEQAETVIRQTNLDENTVLEHLRRTPGISIANIARAAGWVSAPQDGKEPVPNKTKVNRLLKALAKLKLAKQWRGGKWEITDAGRNELETNPVGQKP